MTRKNFKCVVAYKGLAYYGWQKQKEFVTVQGLLEYALNKIFKQEVHTAGASRTDAGVHAFGQVFNFRVHTDMEAYELQSFLNSLLPDDIVIKSVEEVPDAFNSRWNVRRKFYRYAIFTGKTLLPFHSGLCWHLKNRGHLDFEKMKTLLPLFKGLKNYLSFSKSGSDDKTYFRNLNRVRLTKKGHWVYLDFESRGFLYQMVRKLTMVFIYYGLGKITMEDVQKMFEVQDRQFFSNIAPPDGLYLVKIIYDKNAQKNEETEDGE